jgi:RNA polymerase sigma factor (sigma-70 family)
MDTALLIREAKKGSPSAQKCLFDIWAQKMNMICRRYVKNPEDAEELLQDGFYKFFTSVASFQYRTEAELHAWLKRIMINECLMFLRKKNAFHIVAETAAEDVFINEEIFPKLSASEIFSLIVELPVGYRTVFNLHVVEGMDHKEIGRLLGISEGTSKSQLSRAKIILQKMLAIKGTVYVKRKIQ